MHCCTTNHPKTFWPEESLKKNKTFIFAHELRAGFRRNSLSLFYPVRAGAAGLWLENTPPRWLTHIAGNLVLAVS